MKILSLKIQFNFIIVCFFAFLSKVSTNENVPEDIMELFNERNKSMTVVKTSGPSDLDTNKMYAEGSSSIINTTSHQISKKIKSASLKQVEINDQIQPINKELNGTHLNNEALFKLENTILSLNLSSIDETAHGTSSIKPRKGVSYSKIVPKKGVNYEDFSNYSLPSNHSCFFLNKTNCYDVDYYYNSLTCNCCDKSNDLGELITRQPLTKCSVCNPINDLNVELCTGVCCKNITQNKTEKHGINIINKTDKIFENHKFLNVNVIHENHVKKKKPVVTNVPYDSDIESPFSRSKGEKYIPIIVSIFVLPLVGVLIYFVWKKTHELWDRRYYKRMDFLIDGMYNE